MPELEGPTTRKYNYILGGFGEKKKKQEKKKDKLCRSSAPPRGEQEPPLYKHGLRVGTSFQRVQYGKWGT